MSSASSADGTTCSISQNFVSVVFKRGEGHGHGGEIVEAIEASTLMENVLISADESRHVMASLMEPTGEVVDEMILENPAGEHREGLKRCQRMPATRSSVTGSSWKVVPKKTWRSSKNLVLSDMKTVRAVQKGGCQIAESSGRAGSLASCSDEGSCLREGCFCKEPAGS